MCATQTSLIYSQTGNENVYWWSEFAFRRCNRWTWWKEEISSCQIIDKLVSRFDRCLSAYKELTDLFGVLFMPENMSNSEITEHADALMSAYLSDLNSGFAREPIHFRTFMCAQDRSPSKMLNTVLKLGLPSLLCMFLCFSLYQWQTVKGSFLFPRGKDHKWLGTKMNQQRSKSLSILAIQSDVARELDFDDTVEELLDGKAQKEDNCMK